MSTEIIIAGVSLIGTAVGSLAGILTANKLTNYRIKQLEKKVDYHNNFAQEIPLLKEQIKVINHRMTDIERKVEND